MIAFTQSIAFAVFVILSLLQSGIIFTSYALEDPSLKDFVEGETSYRVDKDQVVPGHESVAEEFLCPICQNVIIPKKLCLTRCSHKFCYPYGLQYLPSGFPSTNTTFADASKSGCA